MKYKVWIEIEEFDEDRDHYQSLDLSFAATGEFETEKKAISFADHLNKIGTLCYNATLKNKGNNNGKNERLPDCLGNRHHGKKPQGGSQTGP